MCLAQPLHKLCAFPVQFHYPSQAAHPCAGVCVAVCCIAEALGSWMQSDCSKLTVSRPDLNVSFYLVSYVATWALVTPGCWCWADAPNTRALIAALLVDCFTALGESHWLYFSTCKMDEVELSILLKALWSVHDVGCKTAETNHRDNYTSSDLPFNFSGIARVGKQVFCWLE